MTTGYPTAATGPRGELAGVDRGAHASGLHSAERVWSETNCYLDLWIELLARIGQDPRPALGPALEADLETSQWTFVKPDPAELRRLYGIGVGELNVWRPVLDHVREAMAAGTPLTVEVDSFLLPDTAGVGYRLTHGKTTVVPLLVDEADRSMVYLHNAGCHELRGADFDDLFGDGGGDGGGDSPGPAAGSDPTGGPGTGAVNLVPFPYIERVTLPEVPASPTPEAGAAVLREHALAADPDAGRRLGERVQADLGWVAAAGPDAFHLWSFGMLRAIGSTAELCSDVGAWLRDVAAVPEAAGAVDAFRDCAQTAKSVQFRLARVARGRAVDPSEGLDAVALAWSRGCRSLADVLR